MSAPTVLVDGSSYLYRAYHAMPNLSASNGQPTGAVRGVISMLRRLSKDYPESTIIVIFDAKGKTFRDDIFSQYKANRPPMPDDLREQIAPIHEIVKAMGLPLVMVDNVEADDVIGTLAAQAKEAQESIVISTGDKDMAQLVCDKVTLVNTMTEVTLDIEGVHNKFGIGPELIIDYLALRGDSVDNIPGVPGVGEKTAIALLQGLGGLDDIYAQLDKIPELSFRGAKTMAQKLEEHKDNAYLSYQLATIKTDVELEQQLHEYTMAAPDEKQLLELFKRLEFKSWIAELQGETTENAKPTLPAPPVIEKTDYQTILDAEHWQHWLGKLREATIIAIDTETNSLDYMQAKIIGFSFCVHAGEAAYLPVGHDYMGAPEQLALEQVLTDLKPLLEDPAIKKVGQNIKYDAHVLQNHGVQLQGIAFDTMLESYVWDATASKHDMDSLAKMYLNHTCTSFESIAGKGAKQITFNQIALEQAAPYACEDADITLRLHQVLWPTLLMQGSLKSVLTNLEIPLVSVLKTIERHGALIDKQTLADHSYELGEQLKSLEKTVYELAGEEFNLGSPKQLAGILFDKLGLPVVKKPKKGAQPSTAEAVLQELALTHDLPKYLLEHRSLSKLKSTYTDKLPQMINPDTGRVHTSYHQAITATGRLSSSDPNLQNIPIRTAEGRRIRQAFVAPQGYKILAADYSQIELRIMAHLSDDQGLLDAFSQGLDIHRATAAEVNDVALEDVTDEQRRSAKAVNFGLIYGMSAFGLAKQLHISRTDAQYAINRYFERYPGVKRYMDATRANASETGFVETVLGRRLYLPEIRSSNAIQRQAAERTAINAPMQGTAADIIKQAMISVDQWLRESNIDAKIIMQVHDELVFEVAESAVETLQKELPPLMANAASLKVPLVVDIGVGNNWDEAH